ncbi:hypothetical protein BH11BAC6_BH11BAC6_07390 [soil metagenome]
MNKTPSTFVIFTPAFAANETDSNWLPWLQTLIKAMNKVSPAVNIIIFSFQYPYHLQTYRWHNNTVISFNGTNRKKFNHLIMWFEVLQKFRTIKKQHNVSGILALWCGECSLLAKFCSTLFSVKYYSWVIGQDARPFNKYVKWIKPKPATLIAMSDFLADTFYKNFGIKAAHVIVNGVDTSLYKMQPSTKDIDVIGVGSFIVLKQYDHFVEIINELKKIFPNIHACLCGDGEERSNIEQQIANLSLQNNLQLYGFLPHTETLQMMQCAKIMLHPSSYEGFSTACLEALYAGAHVISFVEPMHNEIEHWHIVKTKNEMLEKAIALLKDETTNYKSVLVNSIDNTAIQILQLFNLV